MKSRYNETHRLERIGESLSHLFLFVSSDGYYRLGGYNKEEDSYDFVDPSGGPFMRKGTEIDGNIIKSISKDEEGVIIEFE